MSKEEKTSTAVVDMKIAVQSGQDIEDVLDALQEKYRLTPRQCDDVRAAYERLASG